MTKVANDRLLTETLREARTIARRWQFWTGLAGIGVVIGLAGPFGTFETLPAAVRTAYWLGIVLTCFWLGYLATFILAGLAENLGLGYISSTFTGAALAGLPVTLWLAFLHSVFFGAALWPEVLRLLPYVVLTSLITSFVFETLAADAPAPASERQRDASEPVWLDRLPHELGRDLMLLQSQDHYLRVKTKLGETLIRGVLQEAAEELGEYGLRLHRSWWVARSAIRSFEYRKGAPVIVLTDGQEIPVGRTYRRSVRESLG